MNNLEFSRELHKTFMALGQDVSDAPTLFFVFFPNSGGVSGP